MKQKHSFFVTAGIPSLFLIFSVLVLAVLSLLTLGNSRSSLNTARRSLDQTEAYYTACREATETITTLKNLLAQNVRNTSDEDAYFSEAEQLAEKQDGLTWDSDQHTISFSQKISDTQQLSVILKVLYPDSQNSPVLEPLQWSTELTDTWKPDNSQNVFKGE